MKKTFLLIFAMLLVTSFVLIGCSKNSDGLKNNPAISEAVVNNGGISVQKGDYLYFINGFYSSGSLKAGQNYWGDFKQGAIYRTKLNGNNSVGYNADGFLTNVDLVVPKLVGYENGAFYIYGDYIYYTSPTNEKNSSGGDLTTLTDYFRVKINGTENTKLYTSKTANLTANDWSVYVLENTHYLVVKDGSNLISVKASGKVEKPVTMAQDITSTAFLNYDKFYGNKRDVVDKYNNYIYFTRNLNEDEKKTFTSGNVLARVKINTSQEERIYLPDNTTSYTMVQIKNNSIYYNKSGGQLLESGAVYRNQLQANGNFSTTDTQLTYISYDKLFILDNETNSPNNHYLVAYTSNSNMLELINGSTIKTLLNKSVTILKMYDNKLLYLDSTDSKLKIIDVRAATITEVTVPTNDKTIKTDATNLIDFDGITTYFFAAYTGEKTGTDHYYLNRTNLNTYEPKSQFIGDFVSDHIPAKPDNTDKPEDEWEIWIK